MDRKKERVHWEQRGRCVRTVNLRWCHISGCFCILIAISLAAAFWPPATFSPFPFLPPVPPSWARIRPPYAYGWARGCSPRGGWSRFPKPAVIYALFSGASSEPWEAEGSCECLCLLLVRGLWGTARSPAQLGCPGVFSLPTRRLLCTS